MKKTVAFIDGENFYYKLGELGMRPWHLDWSLFLQAITPPSHEMIRGYYYKTGTVSSYDFSRGIPRKVILGTGETREARLARAQAWHSQRVADHQKQLGDYEQQIATRWGDIEIKRVGVLRVDPWEEEMLGEKGLDVGLAVDMLELASLADAEILVSGDSDYAPAVRAVKAKLKKVFVVRFFSGPPPRTKGMGADLLTHADEVIDLYEDELWDKIVQPQFKKLRVKAGRAQTPKPKA